MVKLKMNMLIAVVCLGLCVVVHEIDARGSPPRITVPGGQWPEPVMYVMTAEKPIVQCKAKANPPATYYWTYNGTIISEKHASKMLVDKTSGDLTFLSDYRAKDVGDFQCFASNEHGTAMTPFIRVIAAELKGFSGTSTIPMEEYVSKYLKLDCRNLPPSSPPWEIRWGKGNFTGTKFTVYPEENKDRMVVDKEGNLHILWTEMSDNNYIFGCSGYNKILLILATNTQVFKLSVKDGAKSNRPIELLQNNDVQVYAGETGRLMCIFTYYSNIGERLQINWIYEGNTLDHKGHTLEVKTNKTELLFLKSPSQRLPGEGQYKCEAVLGDQVEYGTVNFKVVSPPYFKKNEELETKSVPVEEDAVFTCGTTSHMSYSEPPVWFVNAVPLIGCPDRQFECKKEKTNGYSWCIPMKSVCDHVEDCTDGSDEWNCPGSCDENLQLCNGECISASKPCLSLECKYPEFMCRDKKACLSEDKVCNGNPDCKDGSDEFACPGGDVLMRNRFELNSERTQLTLRNVDIDDSMCFQCLVRNEYGSTIGDGCLTVIDKIKVQQGPNATYYVHPDMKLDITVDATTDISWQRQMKFRWLWYEEKRLKDTDKVITEVVELPPLKGPYGRFFQTSMQGRNFVILFPKVKNDDQAMYDVYNHLKDRTYTLVIEHKYDRVELNFTITGEELIKPTGAPVVVEAATNLWFIALILAILILFIVVALIVCYMYRNRGGVYLLDKKEHQAGHDPAQELKDSGFHDVGRVDDDYDGDKPQADEASLSESVKPYESDDDPTEEYGGDFDVSKFNEDGSFIGLYGDKKSKYSSKEATV